MKLADIGGDEQLLKDIKSLTQGDSGESNENATVEGDQLAESEDGEASEEASEQEEESEGTEDGKPKPYTDEELLSILDADGKLDSNRLTPAQKLIQRSFARHAEKGYQEIAAIKRGLEEVKKNTVQAEPKTIEEAFDRNPKEVLDWIDGQLASVANEVEKDPLAAVKQIAQLQATRNRLTDRQLQTTETKRSQKDNYASVVTEISKAIPDIKEKQALLTEFAISELGYSEEDLIKMTHPSMGRVAINTVKTINAAYDAKHGIKKRISESTDKKKVVKMPIVEGTASSTSTATNTDAAKMKKAVANAQKTGDWTEVLNLKGVLPRLTAK